MKALFLHSVGITAPYYTITTSVATAGVPNTVELRAYIPPDRVRRIIWSRTDLATGFRTPRSAGQGQRSISFAATVANAGIYEAYIDLRYLRTWHAIFHVIVRGKCNYKVLMFWRDTKRSDLTAGYKTY